MVRRFAGARRRVSRRKKNEVRRTYSFQSATTAESDFNDDRARKHRNDQKIEAQYLSAVEDENRALRLIDEGNIGTMKRISKNKTDLNENFNTVFNKTVGGLLKSSSGVATYSNTATAASYPRIVFFFTTWAEDNLKKAR